MTGKELEKLLDGAQRHTIAWALAYALQKLAPVIAIPIIGFVVKHYVTKAITAVVIEGRLGLFMLNTSSVVGGQGTQYIEKVLAVDQIDAHHTEAWEKAENEANLAFRNLANWGR